MLKRLWQVDKEVLTCGLEAIWHGGGVLATAGLLVHSHCMKDTWQAWVGVCGVMAFLGAVDSVAAAAQTEAATLQQAKHALGGCNFVSREAPEVIAYPVSRLVYSGIYSDLYYQQQQADKDRRENDAAVAPGIALLVRQVLSKQCIGLSAKCSLQVLAQVRPS